MLDIASIIVKVSSYIYLSKVLRENHCVLEWNILKWHADNCQFFFSCSLTFSVKIMLDVCWFMFFSELVSTQLHPCHFAAIMFWRSITFPLMKWLSLLSKARRIVCKIWNLIGMNLLVLLWGLVGSSGLVQLYSFGDGSISNAVMIFLYVSMPHKDYAVQKTYVMESYLHLLFF